MSDSVMHFENPIDFDGELPPDPRPGQYEARVSAVRVQTTKQDGFPMLVWEWELTTAGNPANREFEGHTVADFITFYPKVHKAYGVNLQRLEKCLAAVNLTKAIIPRRITGAESFGDLIGTALGKSATVWLTEQTDREGVTRTKVSYERPKLV